MAGAVKVGCCHIEAQGFRSQGQMDLQDLSDIHTGRHAQRIQDDIQRPSVGKIRHILDGQNAGNDTLVAVTACHLIADRDLSLLRDVNANRLVHTGGKLISVLSGELLGIYDNAVFTVGNLQGCVTNFTGLFTEDRAQQALFRSQLGLALGCDFTDQDISRADLSADTDDTFLIKILEGFLTDARNIAGNLFRSELGITGFTLVLFDVDRCVDIVTHKTFAQKNSVLIVVTFPGHESDQGVLSEGKLTVAGRRTVRDNLSLDNMLAGDHDRFLVVAVALIAALELGQMICASGTVFFAHNNASGIYELDNAVCFGKNTDAGVDRSFDLHACTDCRRICCKKRHCLTLHVRTHQGAVCVIVLQEGNQRCCDREDHTGRDVHIFKDALIIRRSLCAVTSGYIAVYKVTVFIQFRTRLRDMVIIFFIRSHIYDFVRYTGAVGVCLVDLSVRSLNKAVLVDAGIACKGVDQTDVGTFRSLDRAHSPVMCIVNVTDLKSCAVSGQTAGAQCGQTALMGQLTQRVVLVHELGQLGRTEEFLDSSLDRFDVDQ